MRVAVQTAQQHTGVDELLRVGRWAEDAACTDELQRFAECILPDLR